jgi:hypothetical protein
MLACGVMLRILRTVLVLLIALAIVGGTTTEFARSAQYGSIFVTAEVPCDMAMAGSTSGDTKPMAPCKGMTPDCIKLTGCVTISALPAHFLNHVAIEQYTAIDYWTAVSEFDSLAREPEPLPPRTT